MNKAFKPLDLNLSFIQTVNRIVENNNNEVQLNNYENSHVNPPFRYYNKDIDISNKIVPDYNMTYKTKSFFGYEKPTQTENDEIGINESFLNSYYGYTDYGFYKVANQSIPESFKHKTTPKNRLAELIS